MVTVKYASTAILVFGIVCSTHAQTPVISSFSPVSVCQGDAVTITGSNFTGATNVRLGTLNAASFVINSSTSITAIVANTASSGPVTITTPAGLSPSGGNLIILPAPRPALADVSPGRDIDFTSCDGSSTYQITVRNNSVVTGTNNVYHIDWGDGLSTPFTQTDWPVGAQTSHSYNGQGYFDVVVTITPSNGCKKSATYRFYQGVPPRASWSTDPATPPLGCAPVFVNFLIGNWSSNSLGTLYVIDYGDNTKRDTLKHPLNLTDGIQVVPHTYNTSSCPATSFVATLDVINACSPTPTRYTQNQIIIRKAPVADFITPSACEGSPVCFTNQTTSGFSGTGCNTATTYLWEFEDGTTSNLQTPPCRNYPAGTYTVKLTASNIGCGSDTKTKQIIVSPSPAAPAASSNSPVCSGGTINLSATTIPGATYSWTGPGGYTSTLQNPSRVNATSAMGGTYNVSVTVNGCTSPRASVNVVLNQTPAAPVATSPVNLCQFATPVPLTATATSGNALLWYTTATGGTGSSTAPIPPTDIVQPPITYYVSQTNNTTLCESIRTPVVVNIRPIPNISSGSSTNPATCGSSTGSIALNGLQPGTSYSVCSSKNGGNLACINLTANSSGIATISNLTAGTYSNITVTLNGCVSNTIGPFSLADPNPPATPTANSNGPLCSGSTLNLTSSTTTTGVTYLWSGPNNFTNTAQNPSIPNVSAAASGTYLVTARLNGCTSAPGSVAVVINLTPATPTAGSNSPVCAGGTLDLTSSTTSSNVTYAWTGPNNFSSTLQNPTISNVTAAAGGTYIVVVSTATCSSTPRTITVTLTPPPVISGSSFSNPASCASATGSIVLNGLTPNTNYSVSYSKNNGSSSAVPLTSNGSGVITISNLTGGSYDNITASLNGCVSNRIGPISLAEPNTPATPVAGSNTPLCSEGTLNLTASSSTPGVSYLWTGPGGYTSNQQNPTRVNVTTSMGGTYSVTASLSGCTSASSSATVVINPIPTRPDASSNSPVCSGETLSLTSSSPSSGVSYTWTGPNGFSSSSQNPVIPTVTTGASGTYAVVARAGNCSSVLQEVIVNVIALPKIAGSSTSNPSNCTSSTGSILLNGLGSLTAYTVSYNRNGLPVTAGFSTNSNGVLTITGLTAGVYDNVVVVASNKCVSNAVGPFTLVDANPPSPTTVASNSPICSGGTLNLSSSTSTPGVTYLWSGPNNFSSSAQNPTIPNVTTSASGTYSVTTSINGCSSAPASVNVLISQTSSLPVVSTPLMYCKNEPAVALSASAAQGNTLIWYSNPVGGAGSSVAPVPGTANVGVATYYVSQRSGTGCESERSAITVSVNARPTVSILGDAEKCAYEPALFLSNIQTADPLVSYRWRISNGASGSSPSLSYTFSVPGTYTIQLLAGTNKGCFDSTVRTIQIGPSPLVNIGPDTTLSAGSDYTFRPVIQNGPIRSWTWSPAFNLSCVTCPAPVARIDRDITYYLTVQNNYGCTASDTINIKTLCDRSEVFIPKAFSPDGDGINDIFMIRGGGLVVDDFIIYNRWGQIVYEVHNNKPANDPSFGWNGMFNKRIIQDVYSYVAVMHCAAGSEKFTRRGMVTLILAK